MTTLLKKELII